MHFLYISGSGHECHYDTEPRVGGDDTAIRPVESLIGGMMSCTSMDVISILRKMGVKFNEYWMEARYELTPQYPKMIEEVYLEYNIKGNDVDEDKFKKAIELSQNKYCIVSTTLKKAGTRVTYECKIHKDM